jgi:ribosomal protein L37AE/L43A
MELKIYATTDDLPEDQRPTPRCPDCGDTDLECVGMFWASGVALYDCRSCKRTEIVVKFDSPLK